MNNTRSSEKQTVRYNEMRALRPKEWVLTKGWMTNRALFLIALESERPLMFSGNWTTYEEWLECKDDLFSTELSLIEDKYPEQYRRAATIWLHGMGTDDIGYIGGDR